MSLSMRRPRRCREPVPRLAEPALLLLSFFFLLLLFLLLLPAPARALTYVESSGGLSVPVLDTGRTEVEFSDVNEDGKIDLVSVGDHGNPGFGGTERGLIVWYGDGTGSWSYCQYGNFGYGGIALGDLNGDGRMDAAYGIHHNYSGQDLGDQILEAVLGDGTGCFWTPWDDGLASSGETWGMFDCDLADFDADGDLDLVSNSFGCCAGVHVYRNNGDGTWTQTFGFLDGNSTQDVVCGDVNGDGAADFAVCHQGTAVYLGDGHGGFTSGDANLPAGGSVGRKGVALGDVNGDGRDDLSLVSGGAPQVWLQNADGTWTQGSGGLPGSGSYETTQMADTDLDGHIDLCAFGNRTCTVWTGDGGTSWIQAAQFTVPSPGYYAAFRAGGDVDHNGRPDLAIVSEEGSLFNTRNHLHVYKETSPSTELFLYPVRPRGHETFRAGAVVFVDWTTSLPTGGPATVGIEFSATGAGGPWFLVADGLPDNGRYQWTVPSTASTDCRLRLTVHSGPASAGAVTPASFTILGGASSIEADGGGPGWGRPRRPEALGLTPAPNPFTEQVVLRLDEPAAAPVAGTGTDPGIVVTIADPAGRTVRAFRSFSTQGSGPLVWDGRDGEGRLLPSGVYGVRVRSARGEAGCRVVRLR